MGVPESPPDNRVALTGRLLQKINLRQSPAGIPIARFTLEHESLQQEAGVQRQQRFLIGVRASGPDVCANLAEIESGTTLRVFGHLARSDQASENYRLLICASKVAILDNRGNKTGA